MIRNAFSVPLRRIFTIPSNNEGITKSGSRIRVNFERFGDGFIPVKSISAT